MRPYPIGNGTLAPRIPREVAALMVALQLKGRSTDALDDLTDREWQSLLQFCEPAQLTLQLAQINNRAFPSLVTARLAKNVADNFSRFEHVKTTYREVANTLKIAGVEHLVLKGFTQSPHYVANPRFRAQGDIDLYCPPKMLEHAQQALQSIGYQPELVTDYSRADHVPTLMRQGNWKWRGNVFDPDMPLSIELHYCLWNDRTSHISVKGLDSFWQRRITRTIEDLTFPDLDSVDHLGYFTLHILRNLLQGDWVVNHVYELAVFLHNHATDHKFWNLWRQNHSSTLRALEAIVFAHARAWFSCDLYEDLDAEITRLSPAVRQWLHLFIGASLEGMFRQNKDWIWLHAALLHSHQDKRRLVWHVLVPKKIVGMNHNATMYRNKKPARISGLHPLPRYVFYLFSRLSAQARIIPETILHGFRWWVSQRELGS